MASNPVTGLLAPGPDPVVTGLLTPGPDPAVTGLLESGNAALPAPSTNLPGRWWVGLNVGSDQSTILGTASILSPNGYESLQSGNKADDAKFAAAAKKNAGASKPNTISVENVSWYNINGPYATQAKANAAIPAIQKAHPAPGETQQIANEVVDQNGQAGAAANPVTDPWTWVENFLGGLTSANLWIRVAKVVVGGAILIVGVAHMTGLDSKATGIAKTALKAAPLL